jgi:hypothetical protein
MTERRNDISSLVPAFYNTRPTVRYCDVPAQRATHRASDSRGHAFDLRQVEVWRAGATAAEVQRALLVWQPQLGVAALEIELETVFKESA